jgi:hypothetical protein
MSGSGDYTLTPNLNLYKPAFNKDVGNWGSHWNTNADTLDSALATSGGLFLPLSGGTMTGALNVTATGGNTVRSVQDRWADVINVRDFGAKGDGITDDTAAINAAVAHGRTYGPAGRGFRLTLPSGNYLVTSPLNFTGINASYGGAVIDGCGSVIIAKMSGGAVIDAMGSRWLTFRDLTISGDATTTPAIGLQIGRTADGVSADVMTFDNVSIYGSFTFTAFYNLASENFTALSSDFRNLVTTGWCMVLDGLNHWNASSSFVSVTTPVEHLQSFNETLFLACTWQANGSPGIVWLGNVYRVKLERCYAANTAGAAFVIYQPTSGGQPAATFLDVDCHLETTTVQNAFLLTAPAGQASTLINGFSYTDHQCQAAHAIMAIDPGSPLTVCDIRNAVFRVQAGTALFGNPSAFYSRGSYALLSHGVFNAVATQWSGRVDNMSWTGSAYIPGIQRIVASNGGSTTILNTVEAVQLVPAATIASYTLTMPLAPGSLPVINGTVITISSTQTITALTLTPNTGQTVAAAPGQLLAGVSLAYIYDSATSTWMSLGKTTPPAPYAGNFTTANTSGALTTAGGIHCGSVTVAGANDLSKHLDLYGGLYGICVDNTGALDINVNTGATIALYAGGAPIGTINAGVAEFGSVQITPGGPTWTTGSAAPAATAPVGSLYSRVGGAVGATLYVSRGAGTWAAVAGV